MSASSEPPPAQPFEPDPFEPDPFGPDPFDPDPFDPDRFGPDTAAAVRVRSLGDLLDVLPRLVGFHPRRSAVVVALRADGTVAVTMRADLPPAPANKGCAEMFAEQARQAGASTAVLAVYDDRRAPGAHPPGAARSGGFRGAPLARAVRRALRAEGLALVDALGVRDGRWRSLLCADPVCCPPGGHALRGPDSPSPAAVAMAAQGAVVLADRAELAATVAGPTGPDELRVLKLLEEAIVDDLAALRARGRAAVRADADRRWAQALEAWGSGGVPDELSCQRLALALTDVTARDAVLARAAEPDTDALAGLLTHLAVRAVGPAVAPTLTSLAWVAYARGDGALVNVALDRALGSDPDYSLARLVARGLAEGVHPRYVIRASRCL